MLKISLFQKSKYFFLAFSILFVLFLLFNSQFSSAKVCLPLEGYLVWPETWEPGRIPIASSSQYFLTASPFYVSGGNVGLNTTNPVYTLQVNGTISANELCIGSDCISAWPAEGISPTGQAAFWTGANNLSGSNNLLWDNHNSKLQVNGNVVANNFLGTINASNVSAGTFGANTGGGNYSFLGNVGIGTTAPTKKLEVNGVIGFSGGKGPFCIFSNICPTGWVDKGLGGYIYNSAGGATCPYTQGVPFNNSWTWCHPRICCNE